jgi:DNA-binding response OmpR family regulator
MIPSPPLAQAKRAPSMTTTILVVDDDDNIRGLLRAMLERGAHLVVEAEDGREALALIERVPLDLIVLDVNLPDVDGPELCRRVKADEAKRRLPVLMLTAATQEENRKRCLEAGADGYLTKPFSPLALLDLIEKHLGNR